MPKDIHQRDTAQQRSSRLLLAMGIIVLLGALAIFVLTLVGQPPHPRFARHPLHRRERHFRFTMNPPSGRCVR